MGDWSSWFKKSVMSKLLADMKCFLFLSVFFCRFFLIEKTKENWRGFSVSGKSSLKIEGRRTGEDVSLEKRVLYASSARYIHCWHNNRYSPLASWYCGYTFGGPCLIFPPYTSSPPAHLQQNFHLLPFTFTFAFAFTFAFNLFFIALSALNIPPHQRDFFFEGFLVFSKDRCQNPQTADRTRTRTQKERLPLTTRPPRPPARPRPLLSHARFGPAFWHPFTRSSSRYSVFT